MFKNQYELSVDIKKKMTAVTPAFVQYDHAVLIFRVFDGGKRFDLTGFTSAEVTHRKPDGTIETGEAVIEGADGDQWIKYTYFGSEMDQIGYVDTSLTIHSDDKKVSIQPFKTLIVEDLLEQYASPANPQVGALQQLIASVEKLNKDTEALRDDAIAQTAHAKEQGDYAKAQGDYAKAQGEQAEQHGNLAKTQAELAEEQAGLAENAATEANLSADRANEAAENADSKATLADDAAARAEQQADYAKEQGDFAKEEAENLSQLKAEVEKATEEANTVKQETELVKEATENERLATESVRTATEQERLATQEERLATEKVKNETEDARLATIEATNNAQTATQDAVAATGEANKSAERANSAADEAISSAEHARETAQLAVEKAENAADLANQKAQEAENSALNANNKATLAEEKANLAEEKALLADTAAQDATTAKEEIEAILPNVKGMENKGEYSGSAHYYKNNIVEFNGSSYQALQDTLGNPPPTLPTKSNLHWALVAQRGVDGIGSVASVNGIAPDANGNVDLGNISSDWEDITNKPTLFPPTQHNHQMSEIEGLQEALDNAGTKELATPLSDGLMPKEDKEKLDGIEEGANFYVHPDSHPATMIIQDENNRMVTDIQITEWEAKETPDGAQAKATKALADAKEYADTKVADLVGSAPETLDTLYELAEALGQDPNFATTIATQIGEKVDKEEGKGLSTNDYTTEEKNKLAGIAPNANNYVHPTTAGNKHIPAGGSEGEFLKYASDGTATWATPTSDDIKETSAKKFVSEAQIADWDSKETVSGAQEKADTAEASAKEYTDKKVIDLSVFERQEEFISTEGQTFFELAGSYEVGKGRLSVTVGGVPQYTPDNFTETSENSFTLAEGLPAGELVVAKYYKALPVSDEVETPEGAQAKADTAEQNAKAYTDVKIDEVGNGIIQQDTPPEGIEEGRLWIDTSDDTFQGTVFDGLKQDILDAENSAKAYADTKEPVLRGSSRFRSTTGVIIPHTIGHTDYIVLVTPSQNPHGYLGEVWVEYASESFKVCCSGSATTRFSYLVFDVSKVKEHPWFDLTFELVSEADRDSWGGIRKSYQTNEVTIPFDCTLYVREDLAYSDFGNTSVYWVKNGQQDAINITSVLKPSKEFKAGDKFAIYTSYVYYPDDPDSNAENTIDFEIFLDSACTIPVANPYMEYEGSDCYLTTAMVYYYGKDDDGKELTSMRALRQKFKDKHAKTLEEYSLISPLIIRGIEQSGNRDHWYNEIKIVVDDIVDIVGNEQWEEAEATYLNLYNRLKEEFYI